MKPRFIILALLILLLITPVPILAAEPDNGKIEGSVFNATDGADVADQEVTLKIYLNDSEMDSKTARTDAKGLFVFEGLSVKQGYSYDATTKFQEADYTSDRVDFADGVVQKTLKITVYNATTSPDAIKVDTAHTIIYAQENGLQVKSYALVDNPTNLTYIGFKQLAPDKKETLKFSLPAGAKDPQYGLSLMECCVIPGEGIISDTMPVLPGFKEVVYAYTIPYDSGTYTFTQKFDYPTGRFDLLIQGGSVNVASDKLTPEEPVDLDGEQFSRLSTQDIAAGDAVKIELSGLPENGRERLLRGLLMGLVAIAAGAGVFYFMRRRRGPQPVPARVPLTSGNSLFLEKHKLLAEIAQLDESFEAGRIAQDVYQQQRAAWKARLLMVVKMLNRAKQ